MRPYLVVVAAPRLQATTSVGEADEPLLVQALVAASPVEALHVRILDGLARPDEVELDVVPPAPGVEHLARELRTVVADELPRRPVLRDELGEDPGDARAREAHVDFDCKALAREVVD